MDPITHAVLGASCAEALLYRQDKNYAWIAGGLAAMAPDLDFFIRSSSDPMLFLLYHRLFTHSLLFIPAGALLVTLGLMIFKCFRINWIMTFLAALIGYSTHGFLDACTSYGTVLFWPFSDVRISWDIVSVVDPLITVPLVMGVAWTVIFDTRKGVIIGLILAAVFLSFKTFQHHRALSALQSHASSFHWKMLRPRVYPTLASSTLWNGVAHVNSELYAMEIVTPLTQAARLLSVKNYPSFEPKNLPDYIKKSPSLARDFAIFNWFSDGYLIKVNDFPLAVVDARFLMHDNPSEALWGIRFSPERKHVDQFSNIKLPV